MKKYFIIFIVGISALLIIVFSVKLFQNFIGPIMLNANPVRESSIVKNYTNNESAFNLTAESIAEYSNEIDLYANKKVDNSYIVTISAYDKNTLRTTTNEERIEDISFNANLTKIFNNLKYFAISKNMNTIFFTRESGLSFEQGLAYSLDGQKPASTDMDVTFLDHISGNWYYYRAN